MKLRTLLCLLCSIITLNSYAIGLNDLSILVPLPRPAEFSSMISPFEVGSQGMVLSKPVFQRFIDLVPEHHNQEIWLNQLKVVAIRLDPCFIEGVGPIACSRQIRLVWQPVITEENALTTRDSSIHSFYEFSEEEFAQIMNEWKSWSKTDLSTALNIHPILQKEGLKGNSWKALRSIILKYCGANKLIRMTSMNVMANEQLWIFTGFDVKKDGSSKEMIIPRVRTITQAITQSSFAFKSFTGGMTPAPIDDEEFSTLVEDSYWFKKNFREHQVRKAFRAAIAFENPKLFNTGTLDCASCHLANMAHQWAEVNFPQYKWETEFSDVKYQSAFNISNVTKTEVRPNQFRIFGYFGKEPAISQRVINETAAVAELIRDTYKKSSFR